MLLVEVIDNGQTDAALALQHFGSLLTQSGVLGASAFAVSAQVAPNMSVKVSGSDNGDKAVIIQPDGATYFIKNTADEDVTILANTSGVTKTDAIVLYVELTDGDPLNAGSPGAAQLIAVRRDGTSTGAPTTGEIDAATNNNPWLKLKEVTVTHNTGEIESADVVYEAAQALIAKELHEPLGTDQIEDDAVTSDKIADEAVIQSLSTITGTNSNSHGTATNHGALTAGTWYDITGFSESITVSEGSDVEVNFHGMFTVGGGVRSVIIRLMIGATFIGTVDEVFSGTAEHCAGHWLAKNVSAGTYSVKLQITPIDAGTTQFSAYPHRSFSVKEIKR
jgi:hypothetical protein